MNDKIICENIKKLRERAGLGGIIFAEKIGISQSYLSEIENLKAKPKKTLLLAISYIYNTTMDWLLTGKGEMIHQGTECNAYLYKVEDFKHLVAEKKIEYDPKTSELLKMTRMVLESGTEFSNSLASNIRSFFHSIQMEKRLSDVESRLSVFEDKTKKYPADSEGSGVK